MSGDDLPGMHHRFAKTLDAALDRIKEIQQEVRTNGFKERPRWPMIILRSPKGWTGPENVDGVQVTDSWRAHQVPSAGSRGNPSTWPSSRSGCANTDPRNSSTTPGAPVDLVLSNNPGRPPRMSANPSANGGLLAEDLSLRGSRTMAWRSTHLLPSGWRVHGRWVR